jgi:hypothetical protein
MDQARALDLLRRLGFFYVQHDASSSRIDFLAGHVPEVLQHVASLHLPSGKLDGPYAGLLERLDPVIARYQDEEHEVAHLPPQMRQEWLTKLARGAGLSLNQLRAVARSVDR